MLIRFPVNLVIWGIFVYRVIRFRPVPLSQEPLDNGIFGVDLGLVDSIMPCLVRHRRIGTGSHKDLDGFKVSIEGCPMKRRVPRSILYVQSRSSWLS